MATEHGCIKQKLDDYRWICYNIDLTKKDLECWINEAKRVVCKLPKLDTAELRSLYMGICERLNEQIMEMTKVKMLIDASINAIEDCDIKQVMRLKYIELLQWPDISNSVKLPMEQCHKLHKEGLELLEKILSEAA
jgi:hypothetical protein